MLSDLLQIVALAVIVLVMVIVGIWEDVMREFFYRAIDRMDLDVVKRCVGACMVLGAFLVIVALASDSMGWKVALQGMAFAVGVAAIIIIGVFLAVGVGGK